MTKTPKPRSPSAAARPDLVALRQAFVSILHREQRFGLRDDCRVDLDREWDAFLGKFLGQ